ncbi:hypothetical protein FOA52_000345 [Chlamydomonas sp. UWO 241]|nr:hypothetical protein FOA52_000345 [Chlamydomonas sp. UWO 241]
MRPTWAAVALPLLVLRAAALVRADFNVEEAGIRVLFPPSYRDRRIDWALADFGEPKYGGLLQGRLVYPTEDASYWPKDQVANRPQCPKSTPAAQFACNDFSKCGKWKITEEKADRTIMLVERGPVDTPCYFITKVLNAQGAANVVVIINNEPGVELTAALTQQGAGADAVIVINDEPGAELTTAITPDEEMYAELAAKITISAGLISFEDGAFLKGLAQEGKPVSIIINWTNPLPRATHVQWEFWTNSNDECGEICNEQLQFVKDMAKTAEALTDSGLATFTPHYMVWTCPQEYRDSLECGSQCVRGGVYCAQEPDEDIVSGYSGKDVLAMNLRQLCFFQVVNASGLPDLWWEYTIRFDTHCAMRDNKFTAECAENVFNAVVNGQIRGGVQAWKDCMPDLENGTGPIEILEKELERQRGTGIESEVTIMPAIRIDGVQYRGKRDVAGVTRALCTAFPAGHEPDLCNEAWVSDNECNTSGVGYTRCRVGDKEALGRNRCVNTFLGMGYECTCGQGWVLTSQPDSGGSCEDLNECVVTSITDPACTCDRCACINTLGGFNCTGVLPNMCTKDEKFGGCWHDALTGAHACVDSIAMFQQQVAAGTPPGDAAWTKCQCPACATGDGVNSCVLCDGTCLADQGVCLPRQSIKGDTSGGATAMGILWTVLVTLTATTALIYAAYHLVIRQRMDTQVRSLVGQYMPLSMSEGGGGSDPDAPPPGGAPGSRGRRGAGAPATDRAPLFASGTSSSSAGGIASAAAPGRSNGGVAMVPLDGGRSAV